MKSSPASTSPPSKVPMLALNPKPTLLVKLGSVIIHIEEMIDEDFKNTAFDIPVIQTILNDPELKTWLVEMDKLALLPKKRASK